MSLLRIFWAIQYMKVVFILTAIYFRCNTYWIELDSCCRKLKRKIQWIDKKATLIISDAPRNATKLTKALHKHHLKSLKVHVEGLTPQGACLKIQNMDKNLSQNIYYVWKLNDQPLTF